MDRYLRVLSALALSLVIGGCVRPPSVSVSVSKMVPLNIPSSNVKGETTLMLGEVTGGGTTTELSGPEIENAGFREALRDSLLRSHLFRSVMPGGKIDADYKLDAEILSQEIKPSFSPSGTLFVRYRLTDNRKAQEVWAENIFSEHDAKFSEHPRKLSDYYPKDVRMIEGAARNNLVQLLEKLGAFLSQENTQP